MVTKRLVVVACFLFLFVISSSYAQEVMLLKYNDGRIEQASGMMLPTIDELASEEKYTVTMHAYVAIEDADTWENLTEVYPGQKVVLWTYFTPLANLEVPFEDLIGKTMKFSYTLSGMLKYKDRRKHPIEENDGGLGGVGIYYVVPKDTKGGRFIYKGKVKIKGFHCKENKDKEEYKVVYE